MITVTVVAATAFLAALGAAAGAPGVLYGVVFGLAVVPGLPIGIAVFGPRHPAAWIGGSLIGYGLTQLALWAAIVTGASSAIGFGAAWLAMLAAGVAAGRVMARSAPPIGSSWPRAEVRVLLLVLLLVPVLMGLTYRNLGRQDGSGNRYYRAYFTADFVWHSALAYELGKFSLPPQNPYLAPQAMNYYWTYFLLPSTAAKLTPSPVDSAYVEPYLKANAILVGGLMIGMLFMLVRTASSSAAAAAAAVTLTVVAASAEGFYAIADLLRRGRPLAALLDTNVDAITAWVYQGLRIDNIPRSLWYTPQHTTSIALGLTALTVGIMGGVRAPLAAIVTAGLALGLSTTMNPLLGAACSLIYGVSVLVDAVGRAGAIRAIARHALAAVFVLAAVAWGTASKVVEGAGSATEIGFAGFSRNSPVVTLLLSLGPVLVPALLGVFAVKSEQQRRAVAAGATGIVAGLFLLYFVRISEASWVGFRAGQILLVSIPLLLAAALGWLPRAVSAVLALIIFILGAPTTVVDTFNAQDIGNRRPGPGFRWTLWTTPAQRQAFEWLRAHTRDEDIVQMEPIVRAREHWTLIPSFAGRRMAAGQPISLLPIPEYRVRSEQVRTLYATTNAEEAAAIAHRMGIDYLYVDQDDLAAYPEGIRKFDDNPDRFERVFSNFEVRVYRVR